MAQIILLDEYLRPIAGRREGTGITMGQFRQWLQTVDVGNPPLVAGYIPSSPYNKVNIGWNSGVVVVGDSLYEFARTQLGYSAAQMLAGFQAAADYPISPMGA